MSPDLLTHFHCAKRGLLDESPNGARVNLNKLFGSFTPEERVAWDRWAGVCVQDEFGIVPEGVEKFFAGLS